MEPNNTYYLFINGEENLKSYGVESEVKEGDIYGLKVTKVTEDGGVGFNLVKID